MSEKSRPRYPLFFFFFFFFFCPTEPRDFEQGSSGCIFRKGNGGGREGERERGREGERERGRAGISNQTNALD
jgi:hypothetical protein